MLGAPRSKEFDDVYFSRNDGLAETKHVFLASNGLPEGWSGRERFVIAETGFGTGLNFLAVWKLFRETAKGERLDYISVEKFPLSKREIFEALRQVLSLGGVDLGEGGLESFMAKALNASHESYAPHPNPLPTGEREFGWYLFRMLDSYPPRVPGFHRIMIDENVTLTLIFDDVNMAMPKIEAQVDRWFLDGFKPAVNPDMWSSVLFENMARLSKPGARFATFTAAGFVKRGLRGTGFTVEKIKGYGTKRDMLVGVFE